MNGIIMKYFTNKKIGFMTKVGFFKRGKEGKKLNLKHRMTK